MKQLKQQKREEVIKNQNNFLFVILSLLLISIISAGVTTYICSYVLDSFNNSNAMALIITDTGLKSDDLSLEQNLSTATKTLIFMHDLSMSLVIGCIGVSISLFIKIIKDKSLVDKNK